MKNIEWLKEGISEILLTSKKDGTNYFYYRDLKEKIYNAIDQLDEPEVLSQELPVIPKFVADLMEDYNDASIHSFLSDAFRNYREGRADRADTWITKNPADFVDAYRYGYTVEEKKYYILLPKINRNWLYVSLRSNYDEFIDHYTDSVEDLQIFTEKEIKAVEPRYFAFAVKVEELEE